MKISQIQIEAAIMTAVDKMISAGMTQDQAVEYVQSNLTEIFAWCLKLIDTSGV